jgi:serine/threonine protein kinase
MGTPNISGYKIIRQIGFGGMANVYLAEQESLQRKVALKIMYSHYGEIKDYRKRFLLDGRSAARLSHRRIVSVYDMGMADEHCYIAMEHLPGGTLQERIKQGLSAKTSIEIAKHIAEALAYAHQQGFVHRDIKPMNILFRGDGYPVLTDFGIAKQHMAANTALTMEGSVIGSPKYMSPEQARGETVDGRSDIYSLGIVLFEMLTGTAPYDSTTSAIDIVMQHINDPVPALPPELREYQFLVSSMLAKDPANRPQSAEDLVAIISNLLSRTANPATGGDNTQMLAHHPYFGKTNKGLFTGKRILLSALLALMPIVSASNLVTANWHADDLVKLLPVKALEVDADSPKSYIVSLPVPPKPQPAGNANAKTDNALSAAHYLQKAEQISHHDPDRALSYINEALQQHPSHSGLLSLKTDLTRARDLRDLLHLAQRQQAQGLLSEPPGNNALETYQRLLTLDSGNTTATRAVQSIAEYYRKRAMEEHTKQNHGLALAMIASGLKANPGHPQLLQLKNTITRKQAIAQKKANSLLAQAEQLLTIYPLSDAELSRATDKYRAALELQRNSERANSGMAQISVEYYKLAQQSLNENDLKQTIEFINKGKQANPANTDLQKLSEQVTGMLYSRNEYYPDIAAAQGE